MKCPKCQSEMMISSNKLVIRPNQTYAHKMVLTCRNKKCANYGKSVQTIYHPVEVVEDET